MDNRQKGLAQGRPLQVNPFYPQPETSGWITVDRKFRIPKSTFRIEGATSILQPPNRPIFNQDLPDQALTIPAFILIVEA